jgi:hypothetical protein
MDPISLLRRELSKDLTPEEEAALARELSAAYHMDESAATSRDVQRIVEKVRARLAEAAAKTSADDDSDR